MSRGVLVRGVGLGAADARQHAFRIVQCIRDVAEAHDGHGVVRRHPAHQIPRRRLVTAEQGAEHGEVLRNLPVSGEILAALVFGVGVLQPAGRIGQGLNAGRDKERQGIAAAQLVQVGGGFLGPSDRGHHEDITLEVLQFRWGREGHRHAGGRLGLGPSVLAQELARAQVVAPPGLGRQGQNPLGRLGHALDGRIGAFGGVDDGVLVGVVQAAPRRDESRIERQRLTEDLDGPAQFGRALLVEQRPRAQIKVVGLHATGAAVLDRLLLFRK